MVLKYDKIKSPVGNLYIVSDTKYIRALVFEKNWQEYKHALKLIRNSRDSVILKTKKQLDEYFKGRRKKFDLKCKPEGTAFQLKVWKSLKLIPHGSTKSYKEQARLIKKDKAVRAVGSANGKNPICIIYPCHRVIGSNGSLTGFAGGIKAKKYLLQLEALSSLKAN